MKKIFALLFVLLLLPLAVNAAECVKTTDVLGSLEDYYTLQCNNDDATRMDPYGCYNTAYILGLVEAYYASPCDLSCEDGVKNGDEILTDCGGSCQDCYWEIEAEDFTGVTDDLKLEALYASGGEMVNLTPLTSEISSTFVNPLSLAGLFEAQFIFAKNNTSGEKQVNYGVEFTNPDKNLFSLKLIDNLFFEDYPFDNQNYYLNASQNIVLKVNDGEAETYFDKVKLIFKGTYDPDCTPFETETEACGNSGTRTRDCSIDGTWNGWGNCLGENECSTDSECNDNNACTTDTCDSGTCSNTNKADGTRCWTGSYSSCSGGSYADTCAESKTGSYSRSYKTCSGGSCSVSKSETSSCTVTRDTDGTSCGDNKVCDAGACVDDTVIKCGTDNGDACYGAKDAVCYTGEGDILGPTYYREASGDSYCTEGLGECYCECDADYSWDSGECIADEITCASEGGYTGSSSGGWYGDGCYNGGSCPDGYEYVGTGISYCMANHPTPSYCCTEIIDTAAPSLTLVSVDSDSSSPYEITRTSGNFYIVFNSNEDIAATNGCYIADSDAGYSSMVGAGGGECERVNSKQYKCLIGISYVSDGSNSFYVSCKDTSGNGNSASDNLDVTFTKLTNDLSYTIESPSDGATVSGSVSIVLNPNGAAQPGATVPKFRFTSGSCGTTESFFDSGSKGTLQCLTGAGGRCVGSYNTAQLSDGSYNLCVYMDIGNKYGIKSVSLTVDNTPNSETSCTDGVDNDADGKTDCADSDCAGKSCKIGSTYYKGCQTVADCPNFHNDYPTLDSDNCYFPRSSCTSQNWCLYGGHDSNRECSDSACTANGWDNSACPDTTETSCTDGVDNDADGKTDCADSDCAGKSCKYGSAYYYSCQSVSDCPDAHNDYPTMDGNTCYYTASTCSGNRCFYSHSDTSRGCSNSVCEVGGWDDSACINSCQDAGGDFCGPFDEYWGTQADLIDDDGWCQSNAKLSRCWKCRDWTLNSAGTMCVNPSSTSDCETTSTNYHCIDSLGTQITAYTDANMILISKVCPTGKACIACAPDYEYEGGACFPPPCQSNLVWSASEGSCACSSSSLVMKSGTGSYSSSKECCELNQCTNEQATVCYDDGDIVDGYECVVDSDGSFEWTTPAKSRLHGETCDSDADCAGDMVCKESRFYTSYKYCVYSNECVSYDQRNKGPNIHSSSSVYTKIHFCDANGDWESCDYTRYGDTTTLSGNTYCCTRTVSDSVIWKQMPLGTFGEDDAVVSSGTSCSDGMDNDCDGKIDCSDSDCSSSSDCIDSEKPTEVTFTINGAGPGSTVTTTGSSISVVSGAEDNFGVTGYSLHRKYKSSQSASWPTSWTSNVKIITASGSESDSTSYSYTLDQGAGVYLFDTHAHDAAGNWGNQLKTITVVYSPQTYSISHGSPLDVALKD